VVVAELPGSFFERALPAARCLQEKSIATFDNAIQVYAAPSEEDGGKP
jgi:hypothetical protein